MKFTAGLLIGAGMTLIAVCFIVGETSKFVKNYPDRVRVVR